MKKREKLEISHSYSEITIEDVKKWKKELDAAYKPKREFSVFAWCPNKYEAVKFIKRFNDLVKSEYANSKLHQS